MKICNKCNISKSKIDFNKNRGECKSCQKQNNSLYYKQNKKTILNQKVEYYKENQEDILHQKKHYRDNNRNIVHESYKKNYEKHKPRLLKEKRDWRRDNKEKVKIKDYNYVKARKKKDPIYKATKNIRNRLNKFIKQLKLSKNQSFSIYIGCTTEELKKHLENQFQTGMTWENYGKWEIDHIIPLAIAKTIEKVYKLSHYTNLQPLWKEVNRQKGKRIK